MACPYFLPTQKSESGEWLHPTRLPLGGGWIGSCSAPGHEGIQPSDDELRELCNLGYAAKCPRLPVERSYDAVRFSVARETGPQLMLWFVCESGHHPVHHGQLEYNVSLGQWISSHPESRIQKMAECYVQSYLLRKSPPISREFSAPESQRANS